MTEEKILNTVPTGWKRRDGASNPRGYVWYYNGEPRFKRDADGDYHYNPDYKQALVREEATS